MHRRVSTSLLLVCLLVAAGCGSAKQASDRSEELATPARDTAAIDNTDADNTDAGRELADATAPPSSGPRVIDLRDLSADSLGAAMVEAATQRSVEELILSGEALDDQMLAPLLSLPNLKRLKTEQTAIGDATLTRLAEQNRLELLYLVDAGGLTSEGVGMLGRMTRLRNLRVSGPMVDDRSATVLAKLHELAALSLHETAVSDETLPLIEELVQLRELSLFGTPVTDASLDSIAKLPRLIKLRLRQTAVKGENAEALARMPVVDLELAETEFSNAGMPSVAAMPSLQMLNLWSTKVDDDGVQWLRGKEPLRSLNLDNLPGVTDRSLDVIATLLNLEFLHLGKTAVTPAGLSKLEGLRKLKTLHITRLGASDAEKEALLRSMPSITELVDNSDH